MHNTRGDSAVHPDLPKDLTAQLVLGDYRGKPQLFAMLKPSLRLVIDVNRLGPFNPRHLETWRLEPLRTIQAQEGVVVFCRPLACLLNAKGVHPLVGIVQGYRDREGYASVVVNGNDWRKTREPYFTASSDTVQGSHGVRLSFAGAGKDSYFLPDDKVSWQPGRNGRYVGQGVMQDGTKIHVVFEPKS
jgi:hypothetical protein